MNAQSFIEKHVARLEALYDAFGRAGLKEFGLNDVCLFSMAKTQEVDAIRKKVDRKEGDPELLMLSEGKLRLELRDLAEEIKGRERSKAPRGRDR